MEEKQFNAVIDENGCISIPVDVLKEMNYQIGDNLLMSYCKPTEAMERCMCIESKNNDIDDLQYYLCIPKELLEECGIPTDNGNVHIMCFDQELTITTERKMISEIPSMLVNLLHKLGVNDSQLAKAMAEECCKRYGK